MNKTPKTIPAKFNIYNPAREHPRYEYGFRFEGSATQDPVLITRNIEAILSGNLGRVQECITGRSPFCQQYLHVALHQPNKEIIDYMISTVGADPLKTFRRNHYRNQSWRQGDNCFFLNESTLHKLDVATRALLKYTPNLKNSSIWNQLRTTGQQRIELIQKAEETIKSALIALLPKDHERTLHEIVLSYYFPLTIPMPEDESNKAEGDEAEGNDNDEKQPSSSGSNSQATEIQPIPFPTNTSIPRRGQRSSGSTSPQPAVTAGGREEVNLHPAQVMTEPVLAVVIPPQHLAFHSSVHTQQAPSTPPSNSVGLAVRPTTIPRRTPRNNGSSNPQAAGTHGASSVHSERPAVNHQANHFQNKMKAFIILAFVVLATVVLKRLLSAKGHLNSLN